MLPQWNTVFTELAVRYCCMQHVASVEYRLYRVGGTLLLHATCCLSGIPPLQSWWCTTVACNMLCQWNTAFTELVVRYCCMQHVVSVEYRLYRVGGALLLHATCCVSGIPPLQSWWCATVACNMLRQWNTAFTELAVRYCCMQHVASVEYRLYRVGGALLLHATCCVSGIPPLQSWWCTTVACNM